MDSRLSSTGLAAAGWEAAHARHWRDQSVAAGAGDETAVAAIFSSIASRTKVATSLPAACASSRRRASVLSGTEILRVIRRPPRIVQHILAVRPVWSTPCSLNGGRNDGLGVRRPDRDVLCGRADDEAAWGGCAGEV